MEVETRVGWHFLRSDWTAHGGFKVEVGKEYVYEGKLVPCESGFHASQRIIDAFSYSSGPIITLADCGGPFVDHGSPVDKFVCKSRKTRWGFDGTGILPKFTRLAVLDALKFWPDAPAIVKEFLETGNEELRAAARDAAGAAAWDAARAAAWAAAGAAAWDAAWAAARDAAWTAARDAKLQEYSDLLRSMVLEEASRLGHDIGGAP